MVRRVATVAKGDQIRRFIGSTGRPRNQVMNVGLASAALITARPAGVPVASKYDVADIEPFTVRR
jgi:hypothetical protein